MFLQWKVTSLALILFSSVLRHPVEYFRELLTYDVLPTNVAQTSLINIYQDLQAQNVIHL